MDVSAAVMDMYVSAGLSAIAPQCFSLTKTEPLQKHDKKCFVVILASVGRPIQRIFHCVCAMVKQRCVFGQGPPTHNTNTQQHPLIDYYIVFDSFIDFVYKNYS